MIVALPDPAPNTALPRPRRALLRGAKRVRDGTCGRRGFTTVELAIALTIVALLAAIAVPSYADHLRRVRIAEALSRLADQRVRLEQYFLDNRRYDDGAGGCGTLAVPVANADNFAIQCTADAATFTLAAVGVPGRAMQGFVYTIDEANNRRTASVPTGWVGNEHCWVVRHDGSCSG